MTYALRFVKVVAAPAVGAIVIVAGLVGLMVTMPLEFEPSCFINSVKTVVWLGINLAGIAVTFCRRKDALGGIKLRSPFIRHVTTVPTRTMLNVISAVCGDVLNFVTKLNSS